MAILNFLINKELPLLFIITMLMHVATTSKSTDDMTGVPPLKIGPSQWMIGSNHNENTDNNKIRKDIPGGTTAGLLQIPCSIVIPPHEDDIKDCTLTKIVAPKLIQGDEMRRHEPLSAFIDTGAQVTVMPLSTARRLNLYSRIDRSYAGKATGVGIVKIIGRLHNLPIVIGGSSSREGGCTVCIRSDVTVLGIAQNDRVDMLIGLDVLTMLGACVNLRDCSLDIRIQTENDSHEEDGWMDVSIPFIDSKCSNTAKSLGKMNTKDGIDRCPVDGDISHISTSNMGILKRPRGTISAFGRNKKYVNGDTTSTLACTHNDKSKLEKVGNKNESASDCTYRETNDDSDHAYMDQDEKIDMSGI